MRGSALQVPRGMYRPLYGDGRLFLLGFVLGVLLAVPTWLAVAAGQAVVTQVAQHESHAVGVVAAR